jgi:hypothetical protein
VADRLIAVLDTNALVRVALAKSPLARALRIALEQGAWILLTSNEILRTRKRITSRFVVALYARAAIGSMICDSAAGVR